MSAVKKSFAFSLELASVSGMEDRKPMDPIDAMIFSMRGVERDPIIKKRGRLKQLNKRMRLKWRHLLSSST